MSIPAWIAGLSSCVPFALAAEVGWPATGETPDRSSSILVGKLSADGTTQGGAFPVTPDCL